MDLYAGAIMSERGEIQNEKRAKQLNNFNNLRYGNITPTDIDGCIEYHNKGYIFIEIKYGDKDLPFGQKLALERLVIDTSKAKASIAIVAEHLVDNPQEQVNVASCKVREIFYFVDKKWRPPKRPVNVSQAVERFLISINS